MMAAWNQGEKAENATIFLGTFPWRKCQLGMGQLGKYDKNLERMAWHLDFLVSIAVFRRG